MHVGHASRHQHNRLVNRSEPVSKRTEEYEFKWTPPEELKPIAVAQRRMFLSADVPGRVVRQTYSGLLWSSTSAHLVSFGR